MDREDKQKQLVMDFQNTFTSEGGKRVLADLRKKSTYDVSSISTDKSRPIDVNRLIYDEGQRAVIIYIFRMLGMKLDKEKQEFAKD